MISDYSYEFAIWAQGCMLQQEPLVSTQMNHRDVLFGHLTFINLFISHQLWLQVYNHEKGNVRIVTKPLLETYIHWPRKAEVIHKLKFFHIILSHTTIIVWCHKMHPTTTKQHINQNVNCQPTENNIFFTKKGTS